jgi:hypothetical protein
MLRLYLPTGNLIIDHRAVLAAAPTLSCLDSEDEVRRLLVIALGNPAALDALRRFWANWHSESNRVSAINDRKLIDRVARMTNGGPLAAFMVYDRHTYHPGGVMQELRAIRPEKVAAIGPPQSAHAGNTSPGAPAPPTLRNVGAPAPANAAPGSPEPGTETIFDVNASSTQERLEQVLRKTAPFLPAPMRVPFTKGIERHLVTTVAVLLVWTRADEFGISTMLDALLIDGRSAYSDWMTVDAARTLGDCFKATVQARKEADLDQAARLLAQGIGKIGLAAFYAAINRGASRTVSSAMKGKPPARPAPVMRQARAEPVVQERSSDTQDDQNVPPMCLIKAKNSNAVFVKI